MTEPEKGLGEVRAAAVALFGTVVDRTPPGNELMVVKELG